MAMSGLSKMDNLGSRKPAVLGSLHLLYLPSYTPPQGLWLGADIVKASVGLRSTLLFCIILASSEQESVSIGCTSSTFWAVVPLTVLGQGHLLHSDEVSLGTGSPVTSITEKGYEFNYLVIECGIRKKLFSRGVIFYSVLYCNIMHKGVTGKIPLRCIVFRGVSSFLDTTPSTINNNLTKFKNDIPSASSCSSWNLTSPCLFALPWIPYFQHSSPSHQSLPLKMPHSLVHESPNVALF
ncbi:oocyte-secreted protein 3 [Balaenoptera ricei]|uniref:oocyte-secreted protein 3 n=1 Tax=Balaenoptera ricei TaxID=2746895 RepID=UPI0028BF3E97|nr:oocyte-secreted protein 3 [Balaenoptera ricei]